MNNSYKNISIQHQAYPSDLVSPRYKNPYQVEFPRLTAINNAQNLKKQKLNICIAAEDIVGPVRNGGIGTAYYQLSIMLTQAGHNVTIVYLRGDYCENETIEYWIEWYAHQGVTFKPVGLDINTQSEAPSCLNPMYALYRYLKAHHYDLVHVSEWRGSGYFCLMAKRLGIAFQDTIFCVKTSSPWLWNREYSMAPIRVKADIHKMHAERRSVELADFVIGGSADLLRWMLDHGYHLPPERTFAQPNVFHGVNLPEHVFPRPDAGKRISVREIVFFGRLEHRKGLQIFCQAIRQLLNKGIVLPKITFLGKYGKESIPTHSHLSVEQYLTSQREQWNVESRVLDNKSQPEAVEYLCGEGRMAVMPSIIENSTMAVYETTQYHIPFIATDVGGTPELVAEKYHDEVLIPPHPTYLAEKLEQSINKGAIIAPRSFENQNNLNEWIEFHDKVKSFYFEYQDPNIKTLQSDKQTNSILLSVCLVLHNNHEILDITVQNLITLNSPQIEIIVIDDGSTHSDSLKWWQTIQEQCAHSQSKWQWIPQAFYGLSAARNTAVSYTRSPYLLFTSNEVCFDNRLIRTLLPMLTQNSATVMTCFSECETDSAKPGDNTHRLTLASNLTTNFYHKDEQHHIVIISTQVFNGLGQFTEEYEISGDIDELINKAILENHCVETIPEPLIYHPLNKKTALLNKEALPFRTIRPYYDAAPLCYQTLLLMAKSQSINTHYYDLWQGALALSGLIVHSLKTTSQNRPVYIWGAGMNGQKVSDWLNKKKIDFAGFIDIGLHLQGKTINNHEIYAPGILSSFDQHKKPFIIISNEHYKQVSKQLNSWQYQETDDYIMLIDPK